MGVVIPSIVSSPHAAAVEVDGCVAALTALNLIASSISTSISLQTARPNSRVPLNKCLIIMLRVELLILDKLLRSVYACCRPSWVHSLFLRTLTTSSICLLRTSELWRVSWGISRDFDVDDDDLAAVDSGAFVVEDDSVVVGEGCNGFVVLEACAKAELSIGGIPALACAKQVNILSINCALFFRTG